jgi:uncharacterized membrane protein
MPSTSSHIPLPIRGMNRSPGATIRPAFSAPVRWTLAVLSWLAFGVAAYLAFTSVTGTSVAGCGVGASNGCDVVLSSSWSKWLGVPVAVLGLACYASLASLSVLLGLRKESANRWITTIFVMLAIVAAGASLWFIGVQVFKIGNYCKYCLVADTCGIVLGIIAAAATVQCWLANRGAPQPRTLHPGLMALRTTMSAGPRAATPAVAVAASPPSLPIAFGGALPLLTVLIGGQLLFAAKTFQVEKLALNDSFKFDASNDAKANEAPSTGTTHVALRVPPDSVSEPPTVGHASDRSPDNKTPPAGNPAESASTTPAANSGASEPPPAEPVAPARERLVKFLGGKLTLDVYKHPLIGSPEAPHIAIEMVSYDCPHCRKMYAIVEDALARYGDQVALLIMPIPLDVECNKLITDPTISHRGACGTARIAISLAKLNPSAFRGFHDFLMTGKDKPPPMELIIPKANRLVDPDKLQKYSRGPEVKKQLEGYVDLFGRLQASSQGGNSFGLPVQILGDKVMSGSVEKPEDVFKAWEENLGVKPK